MTSYSYTITFNDSEHIYLERLLNEKIREWRESPGAPEPSFINDILYKLNNAQIELRSYTEYDKDGIPNIIIKT
jgi:hypothetical protein